jgi:cell division protein FtsL
MTSRTRSGWIQQELPFGIRVRRGKRRPFAGLRTILLGGGVLLLGLLLYVWQHIQVVRLGYQIERLRGVQTSLIQEGNTLRVELSRLRSLKRVEELARRELGMMDPVAGQIIVLEERHGEEKPMGNDR